MQVDNGAFLEKYQQITGGDIAGKNKEIAMLRAGVDQLTEKLNEANATIDKLTKKVDDSAHAEHENAGEEAERH